MKYLRLYEILSNVDEDEIIPFKRFTFNGGEKHIKLSGCMYSDVTIEARLINSDCLMELFIATDALRRAGVENITLLSPYIPYGRQDRVMVSGEPLSIRVVCDLINAQKYKRIYTLDNHSPVTTALLNNCINIEPLIGGALRLDSVLVSPDAGAYKKLFKIASEKGFKLIQATKTRDVRNGNITQTSLPECDLSGKHVCVVDDICDGGRTFVELGKLLKARSPKTLSLYVSHCILSMGAVELLQYYDIIKTTNCFRDDLKNYNWNIQIIKLRKEDLC